MSTNEFITFQKKISDNQNVRVGPASKLATQRRRITLNGHRSMLYESLTRNEHRKMLYQWYAFAETSWLVSEVWA